jgi:hypothetical protein
MGSISCPMQVRLLCRVFGIVHHRQLGEDRKGRRVALGFHRERICAYFGLQIRGTDSVILYSDSSHTLARKYAFDLERRDFDARQWLNVRCLALICRQERIEHGGEPPPRRYSGRTSAQPARRPFCRAHQVDQGFRSPQRGGTRCRSHVRKVVEEIRASPSLRVRFGRLSD